MHISLRLLWNLYLESMLKNTNELSRDRNVQKSSGENQYLPKGVEMVFPLEVVLTMSEAVVPLAMMLKVSKGELKRS